MLGYLSKEDDKDGKKRPDVDGLRGGEKNRYKGNDYFSFLLPDTKFDQSPNHGHDGVVNGVNGGKMDGFVIDFANKYPNVDPSRIMGYHNSDHVPVYDQLAREFLICGRWFSAHPGPTFCNRFYTLTGRLNRNTNGEWEFDNPNGNDFKPVLTKTIVD